MHEKEASRRRKLLEGRSCKKHMLCLILEMSETIDTLTLESSSSPIQFLIGLR